MKAKQCSVLFLTLSCLLSPFEKSNAQSFTGTILGTLKDSTGAVVIQATVTVTNADTNARIEVLMDESGSFTAPLLPPGHYNVEASAPGFKKFVQQGIVLQVQQQARLDITLELGEVTESIVVTADATLLESTTSSVGKVVDNRRIVNLPLNTRNVYSLVFLTPGVTGTVGNNYGEMRWSVNGARSRTMDTLIDGVTASHATVTGGSGISVFPSVDAIEEFKVMGSNYTAEFGPSQGSVLNVVFKSGTNQLHGSAYEFLRNSVFDAQNFFANTRGEKLGSFKRSQFGGVLGGPVAPAPIIPSSRNCRDAYHVGAQKRQAGWLANRGCELMHRTLGDATRLPITIGHKDGLEGRLRLKRQSSTGERPGKGKHAAWHVRPARIGGGDL